MPEKDDREVVTIAPSDVAKLNITDNDQARIANAQQVTPPPPDERTDREKEIDDRLQVLEGEISERRQEQKTLVGERDKLATERSARKKAAAMSPAERAALGIPEPPPTQTISGAGGIDSGETIGDVGASQ